MKQTIKTFYVNAGFFRRFRDPIRVPRISIGSVESEIIIIGSLKYVLSTMGVSKELISKFLIGNRFHVKLRILSPENCKQSLQVKS